MKDRIQQKEEKSFYVFDCEKIPLGRLATRAAFILQGKHRVDYLPNKDGSDSVVLLNSEKIMVTGKKNIDKKYYRFSGYPGGISAKKMGDIMKNDPERILREAIFGMLPKNKLRDKMMKRINIFPNEQHNLDSNKVVEIK